MVRTAMKALWLCLVGDLTFPLVQPLRSDDSVSFRAAKDVSPRFGPLLRSEDFQRPVLEPGIRITFVSVIQRWLSESSSGLRSSTVYAWSILTLSLLRQQKTIMIEPIKYIMIAASAAVPHIMFLLTPDAMAGQADLRPRLNFKLYNTYRARKA